jgi:hypothetical protein
MVITGSDPASDPWAHTPTGHVGLRGPAAWSVIMAAPTYPVANRTDQGQDRAHYHCDDAQRPNDRDVRDKPDNQQHYSENDHNGSFSISFGVLSFDSVGGLENVTTHPTAFMTSVAARRAAPPRGTVDGLLRIGSRRGGRRLLPRPPPGDFQLQGEAEERADEDYHREHDHASNRRGDRNGADYIGGNQEFKPEQDAPAQLLTVPAINAGLTAKRPFRGKR